MKSYSKHLIKGAEQSPVQRAVNSVRDALRVPRSEFLLLVNAYREFLATEVAVLAGRRPGLVGFENAINSIEDVLRMRRWYSSQLEFLEWRMEYLRQKTGL